METIKFECEVITPMFLGGADGKSAELRAPSIKGALRFWWRAMNGHLPLNELHEKEAEIFGGSGEKQGRSKVIVRVSDQIITESKQTYVGKIATQPSTYTQIRNADTIKYLTYGTQDKESIFPKSKFTVLIQTSSGLKEEITKVFQIFSSYGSLGSKSRNGLGSFRILKFNGESGNFFLKWDNISLMKEKITYSAFSKDSKVFKTKDFGKWEDALSELGDCYRLARIESDSSKHNYKNRVYLSEPLNGERNFKIMDRRTKPFFMCIRFENNKYTVYLLYLPHKFTYSKDLLKQNISVEQANVNFDSACNQFISNLKNQKRLIEA